MSNHMVLFVAFLKSFLLVNKTEGYVAARLSVECKDDKECHQKDPNSQCLTLDQHVLCACKINYHLDLLNNTGKCVYGEPPEEDREGLTAAPIILCFMGCVVVEALCLLAFRYWKKHRRTRFSRHGTLRLQAIALTEARFTQSEGGPVLSFMITPEMESAISQSDARTSSPPPYNQTVAVDSNMAAQGEEPPPPYEEAIKHCNSKEESSDQNTTRRKMSC